MNIGKSLKKLLPCIISDIDGVLIRGKNAISRSSEAIKIVRSRIQHKVDNKNHMLQIPFVCLTNGGGWLEQEKAESINKICSIVEAQHKLDKSNIILNFTPLREIIPQFQNDITLIEGSNDVIKISDDCGLKQFISQQECEIIFQPMFQNIQKEPILQERLELINRIQKRFQQISKFDLLLNNPGHISNILILNDPVYWERSFHLILNIIAMRVKINLGFPKLYVVNNDFTYSANFHLPRLAFGSYTNCLLNLIEKIFSKQIAIVYYGKPAKTTMLFAEAHLRNLNNGQIGNIYMIGDNPKSDIRGANALGWSSILVKSGIYKQGDILQETDRPTFIVNDFYEAIQLIFKKEALQFTTL